MRLYVLAILCVVALSEGAGYIVPTVYIEKNENLRIGPIEEYQTNVRRCEIKNNKGVVTVLYPYPADESVELKYKLNRFTKCEVNIYRMTEQEEGRWEVQLTKIHGKKEVNVTEVYNVKIRESFQKIEVFPYDSVKVYPNRQLSMRLVGSFDNLQSCKLINRKDKMEYDIKSNALDGVTLLGQCGFKMNARKDYGGSWTLIADLKNNTAFYSDITIKIQNEEDLKPNTTVYKLKRGESAKIEGGPNAKVCFLEDPHGVKYPLSSGPCELTINSVSAYHLGTWKASYFLPDVEHLIEQNIVVVTYDVPKLESSVSRASNGDLNLLCRVQAAYLEYCMFTKPNGTLLQMSSAVSTPKYDYYGNGKFGNQRFFSTIQALDCGMTIHNPTSEDFGAWRCLVKYKTGKYETPVVTGKILKVSPLGPLTPVRAPNVTSTNAIVVEGDSYQVKCTADDVLSYCWLRSPTGTVHSIYEGDQVEPPQLKYEGSGLELGDCTARMNATKEHAGQWTCHMGVKNGPELQTTFQVTLADSHLMAVHDVVKMKSGSDSLFLACRPLPESNKAIESCRWINPQGHGIHIVNNNHYTTESHSSFCRIQVRPDTSDAGEWHCYARFTDSPGEGHARITLAYKGNSMLSFISSSMLISMVASLIAVIFLFAIYKRKQAIADLDEKVILEKPPKFP